MSTNFGNAKGPLADLRVIELGTLIAGPFCGQLMGDMGADVIKIEAPGVGDPMRTWGQGEKPVWWSVLARNKRCITANLRVDEGKQIVKDLVTKSDFLIENFRPGTMEKWGLDYDTLAAINPGLIMIRVSGFGQTGPYARRPGYASVGEAMGGMRYLNGYPDRPPSRAGISIGDTLAATYACNAALAALHHRERTGEGQVIDSAIYEAVLQVMEATVAEYTVNGAIRERSGGKLKGIAPSASYRCKDGELILAANQETVWRRLCEAIDRPEWIDSEEFGDHLARGRNQDELDSLIEEWTSIRSVEEVEAIMLEYEVPCGRVNRAPEMLEDPQFQARNAIEPVDHPDLPNLHMQAIFPKLSKTQGEIRWPGPTLGAHTEEVLTKLLNYSTIQISDLKKKQVI